jgi:NADPH:quinone reductase-like Zn-dependent oxidoreductase
MKAAVLHEYGAPVVDEFQEPQAGPGQAVLEVRAAGVNPVDISIAAGRFYAGKPPLPSVVGREGVGMLDGERVYFDTPVFPFGSMAERTLIDASSPYPIPDGVQDGVAIAIGVSGLAAWLALSWRAELKQGEHVLVLGASGVLGQIAVQSAKLLGAGRIVAAARSQDGLERSFELGADATVALDLERRDELSAAMSDAADGRIDVVVDPLFGAPFAAAVDAASFGARLVHLGTGADTKATLSSSSIRGKMLVIMGHSNFASPPQLRREAYAQLAAAAAKGEVRVETEAIPLEHLAEAWRRVQSSSHRKIVLVP